MTPANVLLVDDEPGYASMVGARLQRVGAVRPVAALTDPVEALGYLEADEHVDCVVTDHEMPRLTGIELTREIRDRRPDLPVVLHTGTEESGVAERALAAGATACVRKTTAEGYERLAEVIRQATTAETAAGEPIDGGRGPDRRTDDAPVEVPGPRSAGANGSGARID